MAVVVPAGATSDRRRRFSREKYVIVNRFSSRYHTRKNEIRKEKLVVAETVYFFRRLYQYDSCPNVIEQSRTIVGNLQF